MCLPKRLDVPDIDTEDGLKITKIDGALCLRPDTSRGGDTFHKMISKFRAWEEQAAKLAADEISKEEYDRWRYRYPKFDTTRRWAMIASQELSDYLVDQFNKDKE